jgi:hypothetical protein
MGGATPRGIQRGDRRNSTGRVYVLLGASANDVGPRRARLSLPPPHPIAVQFLPVSQSEC